MWSLCSSDNRVGFALCWNVVRCPSPLKVVIIIGLDLYWFVFSSAPRSETWFPFTHPDKQTSFMMKSFEMNSVTRRNNTCMHWRLTNHTSVVNTTTILQPAMRQRWEGVWVYVLLLSTTFTIVASKPGIVLAVRGEYLHPLPADLNLSFSPVYALIFSSSRHSILLRSLHSWLLHQWYVAYSQQFMHTKVTLHKSSSRIGTLLADPFHLV